MLKKALLGVALLIVAAAGVVVAKIGPRNIVGMLRYDQRRDGALRVGDRAPDFELIALDGKSRRHLLADAPEKPVILVFGSFT